MYKDWQDIVLGHRWLVVLATELNRQLGSCYDIVVPAAPQHQLLKELELGLEVKKEEKTGFRELVPYNTHLVTSQKIGVLIDHSWLRLIHALSSLNLHI